MYRSSLCCSTAIAYSPYTLQKYLYLYLKQPRFSRWLACPPLSRMTSKVFNSERCCSSHGIHGILSFHTPVHSIFYVEKETGTIQCHIVKKPSENLSCPHWIGSFKGTFLKAVQDERSPHKTTSTESIHHSQNTIFFFSSHATEIFHSSRTSIPLKGF